MKENPLDEFLVDKPKEKRTREDVFKWWESKRPRYNLICLVGGILSIIIIDTIIHLIRNGEGFFYLSFAGIMLVFGNMFYFFGFLIELLTNRNHKVGPVLFIIISVISLFVLFFPALFLFLDKNGF